MNLAYVFCKALFVSTIFMTGEEKVMGQLGPGNIVTEFEKGMDKW
jgi:hypothetical protein